MAEDHVLAVEYNYLLTKTRGFDSYMGSLTTYVGVAYDRNGKRVTLVVEIPELFPQSPPKVFLTDQGTSIELQTFKTQRWRSNYHIYQVVNEAIDLVRRSSLNELRKYATPPATPPPEVRPEVKGDNALQRQIKALESTLAQKQAELEEAKKGKSSVSTADLLQEVDGKIMDLDEQYQYGEITNVETYFRKLYKLKLDYYKAQSA